MPQFNSPAERRNYEDYIYKEYFSPYFLSGVKKYVERGDTFLIEDIEIFVLNSYPENGFIHQDTNVLFKFGLTKQRCLEKIHNADNKYAMNLLTLEDTINNTFSHEIVSVNNIGLETYFRRMPHNRRLNCKILFY